MNFHMQSLFRKKNRKEAIQNLLLPISWSSGSSITARKELVHQSHIKVTTAYPFMNEEEKRQADAWLISVRHSDLWD